MREKKLDPISIRLPPSLKADLERLAAEDRRSLSQYILLALEAHVNRLAKAGGGKRPASVT